MPVRGNSATANLSVSSPPVVSQGFGLAAFPLNGTTSLSFTVNNPNATQSLTGIGFSDTLPAGLQVASPNGLTGNCGGGTITAAAGSSSLSLSGASLAGNGFCTFSVNVTGVAVGVQANTTGPISSNETGTAGISNTATVTVAVPPTITKTFGGPTVALNGTTSLSFTLTNPAANAVPLTGVGFTDTLPAGIAVAAPNGLAGSCGGGTIAATAGGNSVSLTGATLNVNASCTFSVNVTGTAAGAQNNTTGAVTSVEGGTGGTASASITVLLPPSIGKSFGAGQIPVNTTTSLSFTSCPRQFSGADRCGIQRRTPWGPCGGDAQWSDGVVRRWNHCRGRGLEHREPGRCNPVAERVVHIQREREGAVAWKSHEHDRSGDVRQCRQRQRCNGEPGRDIRAGGESGFRRSDDTPERDDVVELHGRQ